SAGSRAPVADRNRNGAPAAEFHDRRNRPSIEHVPQYRVFTVVVIRLIVQRDCEYMALVGIGTPVIFVELAVVLREALGGVVHQFNAAQSLTPSIESVESEVMIHAHLRS